MPIGFVFTKARAEELLGKLAGGEPLGVVAAKSDLILFAGVLIDQALGAATAMYHAIPDDPGDEGEPPMPADLVREMLAQQVLSAVEYAAVLAGLVRTGGYDQVCGPVVQANIDFDKSVEPLGGFLGEPPGMLVPPGGSDDDDEDFDDFDDDD